MSLYHRDETLTLLLGDAREVLSTMDNQSANCVVTSPPYYGLRDYEGNPQQIGLEASPAAYVTQLVTVFTEVRRVLADDGTLWLNLGDSYYSGRGNPGPSSTDQKQPARRGWVRPLDRPGQHWAKPKDLLGIPWRVAFALQAAGWYLRSDIVWAKRNTMPESVTDRPTYSHEYVFLFTKQPRYWYDADAIREKSNPQQEEHNRRYAREYRSHSARADTTGQPGNVNNVGIHSRPGKSGRNARTVWTISSTPLKEAHFATFPVELPRRCILAGCKPGGTVLDPFSGAGTTALAAQQVGRRAVGIEINATYHDIALKRMANAPLPLLGTASRVCEPARDPQESMNTSTIHCGRSDP